MDREAAEGILAARAALGLPPVEKMARPELSARSHEEAIARAREVSGVDLSTSRVRVGFSRGHLLEVVVSVPLDVPGDNDALEWAADTYTECVMGTSLLETWIGSIDVDRSARSRGLLVLGDSRSGATTYPLFELCELVKLGVAGLVLELPGQVLDGPPQSNWLALEIPPAMEGIQGDRRYASTCIPEALKAALEGLPFSSERFTRGGEVLIWLAFGATDLDGNPSMRRKRVSQVEATLLETFSPREMTMVGSGFGLKRDFVDLWVVPRADVFTRLFAILREISPDRELGFYDSAVRSLTFSEGLVVLSD